ncbi:MAG: 4,5-DOPA dioxygenase extradiol [Psychromonas sp.]|jgi:4,5-DOPA dioxygenase extradiol
MISKQKQPPYYPALFISHGAPMMALEQSTTAVFLQALATTLAAPKAIVIFSAHFDLPGEVVVTSATAPSTVHDFYGFPEKLYQMTYPAPGEPALANQIADLLADNGFSSRLDDHQGWDHGAWIPMKLIYPEANIPIVEVSINSQLSAETHFQLGRALRSLRKQGILILGSGGISHNLHEIFSTRPDTQRVHKVEKFTAWVKEKLHNKEINSLLNYQNEAPYASFNHPTQEHFLPLISVLGAHIQEQTISCIHQDSEYEILALDAYRFS